MMKAMFKHFLKSLALSLFLLGNAQATDDLQGLNLLDDLGLDGGDEILDPEVAFQISTDPRSNAFIADWTIAEGHYLYQDKMAITVEGDNITTDALVLSEAESKFDPIFNKQLYVYHYAAQVTLPYTYNTSNDSEATFKVKYQGCSEISGICYPPQTKKFVVKLPIIGAAYAAGSESAASDAGANTGGAISEQDQIADALKSDKSIWITLALFFGLGLLLAFTPCVFPMIPILSGIIIGQGENITTRKALTLSVVYVLAMALTYTIVGVLVGLSGENIQAMFQNVWVISVFALVFVGLSLSMFGFYELQMPASIQSKLTEISNSQEGGNLIGVAIMGFLSALIVGPCVTAPLIGALIYIADTGDAALGGMALFSLSMGMGAPLILIGASAGKILPRAGAWMDAIKAVFGVLLLALAIWLLERVSPAWFTMSLWGALLIVSSIYMGAIDGLPAGSSGWRKLWKGLGLILLLYGIAIIIGVTSGNRNLFQPLQGLGGGGGTAVQQQAKLPFQSIKGLDGFNTALAAAKGNTVMLDFYADWCVSCKEMEAFTFSDAGVQQTLSNTVLLKADVTPNDEQDKALYKHFGIFGPPAIMFFDENGNELRDYRVVGFVPADKFNQHVKQALSL